MRAAFEILGYKPFHGRMMDKKPELLPLWVEALQAKYLETCEVYGRKEYDKLFAGWNVSCNIPGSLVAEDLIKAYPNAKVVLSTRDVDKWMLSMKESVDLAIKWKSFDWLAPFEPVCLSCLAVPIIYGRKSSADKQKARHRPMVEISQVPALAAPYPRSQRRASGVS